MFGNIFFNFVSLKKIFLSFFTKIGLKKAYNFLGHFKPFIEKEGLKKFKSFHLYGVLKANIFPKKNSELSSSSVSGNIPPRIYPTTLLLANARYTLDAHCMKVN
jgi:hypothetical protein